MKWLSTLLSAFALSLSLVSTSKANNEHLLVLNGVSYHFDRSRNYNEFNKGLGYEYSGQGNYGMGFGYYTNSLSRGSWYVHGTYKVASYENFHIDVLAGVISGYNHNMGSVFPLILPRLRYKTPYGSVTLYAIPPVGGVSSGLIGAQFLIPIK